MKSTILSLVVALMIPAVSSAKVEDFNALINENAKSQQELHTELKGQMKVTRQAQAKAPQKAVVDVASVNSFTNKSMLTFEKETVEYRPSESKRMQRLANEIRSLDVY